ncbi:MAG: efflux RND transporter permease subunit, partial [Cyclobacteriaceae bacterium]
WIRGLPFSISAGVGFIALFGIAVLNGIILISFLNELKHEEGISNIRKRVLKGTKLRLRPVILTAATDILGFFPMAFSTSAGAEVQRPLATVVIGGLFTATLLTLIVLPVLYYQFDEMKVNIKKMNVSRAGLILLLLMIPGLLTAQKQSPGKLNLDQAIQLAVENNAGIKASQLQVNQAEKLKKTAFDPGNTLLYAGTEENSFSLEGDGINSYGVQQSIEFPGVYLARGKMNRQQVAVQQASYDQSIFSLKKQVSQAYYNYLYQRERLQLYRQLDSLYGNVVEISRRKLALGQTGKLENITNQTRWQEIQVQKEQVGFDLESSYQQLASLLQTEEQFAIAETPLQPIQVPADTALLNLPDMRYSRQLQDYSLAQWQVEKNQLLPGLYMQYFLQEVNSQTGFFGYQLGLNIPLWFPPQQGRVQAARIQAESLAASRENVRIQLEKRREFLMAQLAKNEKFIDYYQTQGLDMAEQLISIAGKTYQAGESGYLQYLQSLEQAIRIKLSYLESLNQYNHLAFEIKYLQIPVN